MQTVLISEVPCPKCDGVMFPSKDYYGKFIYCECGTTIDEGETLPYAPGIEDKRKENW